MDALLNRPWISLEEGIRRVLEKIHASLIYDALGTLVSFFLATFQLIAAQSIPWPAGLEIPVHQAESNFNTASAPAILMHPN